MTFPFRAPAKNFAPAPPDTPYRRAQQEWDARMGSAVLSARSWRSIAFASLGLAALLGGAAAMVAMQQRTFVHVVEVSPEGQVMSVRAADGRWSPTEAQVAHHLGRWVRLDTPFSPANGLFTANGRPKRDAILARYREHFSEPVNA